MWLKRRACRTRLTLALAGVLALPPLLQAEELKTVRHESLGFNVDLPAWNIFPGEEDISSIRVTTGAAVIVGLFHMQDKSLGELKAFIAQHAPPAGAKVSTKDFEHPAGPAFHWRSVEQKDEYRAVGHSYFIEAQGVIYNVNCQSKSKTDQEEAAWDELCEDVAASFELN